MALVRLFIAYVSFAVAGTVLGGVAGLLVDLSLHGWPIPPPRPDLHGWLLERPRPDLMLVLGGSMLGCLAGMAMFLASPSARVSVDLERATTS